jgi:hypothetical protein
MHRQGILVEMGKWISTNAEGGFTNGSNPSSLQLCMVFVDGFARLTHQKTGAFSITIFYSKVDL